MNSGNESAYLALALALPTLQILGGFITVVGVLLEFFLQTELSEKLARPLLLIGVLLFTITTVFRLI